MGLDITFHRVSKKDYEKMLRLQQENIDVENKIHAMKGTDDSSALEDIIYKNSNEIYNLMGEEMMYFRKVNSVLAKVHDIYPEDNFDNGWHVITEKDLKQILSDAKKAMNAKTPKEIDMYFPSREGFFFGSTDYDDLYFQKLDSVIKQCEDSLSKMDWTNDVMVYNESY